VSTNDLQVSPSASAEKELSISANRAIEVTLRGYLRKRFYITLIGNLKSRLSAQLRADQAGDILENLVNWCVQYGGNYEDVKTAVLAIFQAFYLDLPPNVQTDFLYLAEEIGFNVEKAEVERNRSPVNRWTSELLGRWRKERSRNSRSVGL
jgi:hypothetical protein